MKKVTYIMDEDEARYLLLVLRTRKQRLYEGYCYCMPRDKKRFEVAYTKTERLVMELEAALEVAK